MPDFPIWATIGAAWDDVWNHKLAVLRAGWPLLVAMALTLGIGLAFRQVKPANPNDPQEVLRAMMASGPYFLGQMLVMPVSFCAAVLNSGGWTRFVARRESGWGFARRSFAPVLVLKLIVFVVIICAIIGAALVFGLVGGLSAYLLRGTGKIGWVFAILGVVATVGFFVLAVRLSLTGAYAAIEEKYDLSGAWDITRGHGWRLFGLFLAMFLVSLGAVLVLVLIALLLMGITALSLKIALADAFSSGSMRLTAAIVAGLAYVLIYLPLVEWNVGVIARAYLALRVPPLGTEAAPGT